MPARRTDPDLPDMPPARLVAWRTRMGFTQAEAAEALGVSRACYIDYETGRRTSAKGDRPSPITKTLRLAMAALSARLDPEC